MKDQATQAAQANDGRDVLPDLYGGISETRGLNDQMRQVIQEFQEALAETILAGCGREIEKRGRSPANWYLSFAEGVKSSLPMQDDFVRKLVRTAEDTCDPDEVDLDGLDTACRQALEASMRLIDLLRDQAAKCG